MAADIDFPSGGIVLPITEGPESNVRRTEFESGDIKQARISQMQNFTQDISIVFTHEDYLKFKDWFRYEALDGSQWFNADDYTDGDEKEYRIVCTPGAKPYNAVSNTRRSHWTVTMKWERRDAYSPPEEEED